MTDYDSAYRILLPTQEAWDAPPPVEMFDYRQTERQQSEQSYLEWCRRSGESPWPKRRRKREDDNAE